MSIPLGTSPSSGSGAVRCGVSRIAASSRRARRVVERARIRMSGSKYDLLEPVAREDGRERRA
jgi:hypothetical protein